MQLSADPQYSSGTVRLRLIQGFCATALGPIVTAFFQIVTVPVLLHFWGVKVYGEWLVLSAIPAYLSLSDVGFGSVARNDMTIRVGAGDRVGALKTFQSTWVLTALISATMAVIVTSVVLLLPVENLLNGGLLSRHEVRETLLLLSLYALISLQSSIIVAGFSCDGRFAFGTVVFNAVRLAESLAVIVAVTAHGQPATIALTLLVARAVGTMLAAKLMLRATPWLHFGTGKASRFAVRALLNPAFAFMAIPAANAITLQGVVTVMGVLLGPLHVAVFSTMRTLTRFGLLAGDAVKGAVWPELSAAYGAQKWALAISLHRHACQAAMFLCTGAVLILLLGGRKIYLFWTHGQLAFQPLPFYLLMALVLCNSVWNTSSIVALAANRHQRLAVIYLAAAMVSLVLAAIGMQLFGLAGAALGLLIVDLSIGWYVIRNSLMSLGDSLAGFLRGLVDVRGLGTGLGLGASKMSPDVAGLRD